MNSDSTSLAATLRAAGAYYKNDRLRDAESCYRQVLAIDPTHGLALHSLARICIRENRFKEVTVLLSPVLMSVHRSAETHLLLAVALEGSQHMMRRSPTTSSC